MPTKTSDRGITFSVHDVERADTLLPLCKTVDGIGMLLAHEFSSVPAEVLYCSAYNSKCVTQVRFHPLIAATHLAFSQHRPLVLSPDMIWITIVQGLAQHIKINAEKLRHKFVQHQGKMLIISMRNDIIPGSPESGWEHAIDDLARGIQANVGVKFNELICDFSTTGDVERIACEVALMDVFEPFFEYAVYCVCGIPEITLEGTPADWTRLREKVEFLKDYDLDWWLVHVREIVNQFERASKGDIDVVFWEDIYKQKQAYGWDRMNGWMLKLIPYTKCHSSGNFTKQNPLFTEDSLDWVTQDSHPFNVSGGVTSRDLPGGIAQVPFKLHCDATSKSMQFLGGFVGVEQDESTFALRPKIGWAVRVAPGIHCAFDALKDATIIPPVEPNVLDECLAFFIESDSKNFSTTLPADLIAFYKICDGVTFSGAGSACKIRSIKDVGYKDSSMRFCDLGDGTFLTLSMKDRMVRRLNEANALPCVVASSFEECITRLFQNNGVLE
jgi:hypothetical protein